MDSFTAAGKIQSDKAVHGRSQNKAFCFACQSPVSLMSFQQAAELDDASRTELVEFLEKGAIHRIHNSREQILICLDSLRKAKRQSPDRDFLSLELARSLEMV